MSTKINANTSGLTESVDTSGILEIQTAGGTAIIIGTDQNANFASTGAITVPVGTTSQRPTPVNGMMRYNSNVAVFEVYANNTWSAANVTPAPTNTVAPVISGSAIVGQNLTSTTGTWSGSPTGYYYQWKANSTSITGQTANVITLTLAENGANITCEVTAYNVAGNSTPATSNSLGPVINGTTANYLQVAGGGGGGAWAGGGGGGGGYLTGTILLTPGSTYPVIVGAGGAGGVSYYPSGYTWTPSVQGSNSQLSNVTASVGGGAGVNYNGQGGSTGGSGGGGGGTQYPSAGFAGTAGQGNTGGSVGGVNGPGGGGGGAGATGSNGGSAGGAGGNGGAGLASSISGVSTYYAGGGGGGSYTGTGGSGGTGGGGGGGPSGISWGISGTANTGGGGGGETNTNSTHSNPNGGGNGGSGIVIISYAGAQQFGGGVISTDGSNTIHTFYTSGSLVPLTALSATYLTVAGGGGGGSTGAGGGAGGLLSGSNVTIDSSSTYVITVGAGGAGAATGLSNNGNPGANSSISFSNAIAIGGGYGAGYNNNGGNGGSGGGGANIGTAGTGTASQGYAGGNGGSNSASGGGGGAGSAGGAPVGSVGGAGGNGVSSSISGTATYYAGGGGGAGFNTSGGTGGSGVGGNGGANGVNGSSATTNSGSGGGGGGAGGAYTAGGNGGSGVVIISYPGSTPMMAGGNVTVVSNTVVHTFTSSGYLTPFVNFNNSLRFRSSATAYLTRTPTVTSNQKTWTLSCWVKRGVLGSNETILRAYDGGSSYATFLYFDTNNNLVFTFGGGSATGFTTNAVFRDPAAWYHIVLAIDTTQATNTNRLALYVNGIPQTFSSVTYPSQNDNTAVNSTVTQYIGYQSAGSPFDGYMAEINLVDGQKLSQYAFGTFNQYGVWAPVRYAGSYGTNGFYLPFTPNTTSTYAGSFNGSNSGLILGSAPTIGTGDVTQECWFMQTAYLPYYNNGDAIYMGELFGATSTNQLGLCLQSTGSSSLATRILSFIYGIGGGFTDNYVSATIQLNQWYHLAVTRSSGEWRMFLNGNQIGFGVTRSTTNLIQPNSLGFRNVSNNYDYFPGYISNMRIVTGTALYTKNFTPPTSPLTAVSGTSLLTCQNATFVDNSTNAISISTTGTTTSNVATPFTVNIAADYSLQGNNFSPAGISLAPGSTYDSMVDVPTLTSANVANYCVLNPLSVNGFTLSAANMQAYTAASSDTYQTRGTFAVSSGKWYWESTVISSSGSGGAMVAVVDPTLPITTQNYTNASAWSYYGYNGSKYNGSGTGYGASFGVNDVIGVALDMDNGTLTFYKNGTSQGTAFTNLTGKTVMPCLYTDGSYSYTAAINFGQQPFTYTPPAGYLPLNTYNM